MRARLLNALLLATLALAISRFWLFLGEPPPSLPAISPGATPPATASRKDEPGAEAAEFRAEAYDVVAARDLFSPARGVVPPAPLAASKPAAKPQPPPKLTLYGVVIVDGDKSAYLLEGTQEGRPRKVRENENFANGVVTAIRADGVTFLFAGNEINVPLRTPKDAAVTPAPGNRNTGAGVTQPETPVAFPRRLTPGGFQPAQKPVTSRPPPAPAAAPGGEIFGDEESPDDAGPEEEMPEPVEEESGD